MTINVLDTKEVFSGDGATRSFAFGFKVSTESDLVVFLTSSDGVETVLELDTDYTVTLNLNQNSNPGGTVTLEAAPGVGVPLVIMRGVEFARGTEFTNSVPPHIIEDELDRVTMYAQQLGEKLDRSLHVSAAQQEVPDLSYGNAATRAGKLAGFNRVGNAALFEVTADGGSIVGPRGEMSASRVTYSAPAIFRREANLAWSHEEVTVTFIWTVDGLEVKSRSVVVRIDPDTAEFIDPGLAEPGDDFTSQLVGTQLLRLTSEYDGVREYAQLAIVTMPADVYPTDTFTPTWGTGEFDTADPEGDVTYTLRSGVVTLTVEAALTAVSASAAMTWDAATLPADIRPAAARTVECLLQYDDATEAMGVVTLNPDGSAVFAMQEISGSQVAVAGAFQTGEAKGLPASWNVVYSL